MVVWIQLVVLKITSCSTELHFFTPKPIGVCRQSLSQSRWLAAFLTWTDWMFCGQTYTALDSHWGNGVDGKKGVGKLGEIISTEVSILRAVDSDIFLQSILNTHARTCTCTHTHTYSLILRGFVAKFLHSVTGADSSPSLPQELSTTLSFC